MRPSDNSEVLRGRRRYETTPMTPTSVGTSSMTRRMNFPAAPQAVAVGAAEGVVTRRNWTRRKKMRRRRRMTTKNWAWWLRSLPARCASN